MAKMRIFYLFLWKVEAVKQRDSLIGERFGSLVVIRQASSGPSGKRRWICICDCGNQCEAVGYDLTHGRKTSCGCRRFRDLTGRKIGKLTVLERSDVYGSRGKRKTRLWRCLCDCGQITYKATDTLTNPSVSMCRDCAAAYANEKARAGAGYTDGTQLARIRNIAENSDNLSGIRGVYLEKKTGRYRARIKFKGKLYDLGSFYTLEDAAAARKAGEERFFRQYLNRKS